MSERGGKQDMWMFLAVLAAAATGALVFIAIQNASDGQTKWAAIGSIGSMAQAIGVLAGLVYAGRQLRQAREERLADRRAERINLCIDAALALRPALDRLDEAWRKAGDAEREEAYRDVRFGLSRLRMRAALVRDDAVSGAVGKLWADCLRVRDGQIPWPPTDAFNVFFGLNEVQVHLERVASSE